jgi:bacteriocin biosynthesis cyclodehydratase domain-containing protein
MRPILRPGTHVLRRASGDVQIGLDPATALVLPDREPVRSTLRLLACSAARGEYADASVLDLLERHGLVVDQRDLMPLLGDQQIAPHTAASLARGTGAAARTLRTVRRGTRVLLLGFGHPGAGRLLDDLRDLVEEAGIGGPGDLETSLTCGVLLGIGEPDRELVDGWARAETPYLVVRLTEGRAVLGPFVAPGRTACLRCIDAHCADADPSWPLLVRQYAAASSRDRADGAPEPVDPMLASLAVAWAARDLASYVDGLRPSTWSSTVTVHPTLDRIETRPWLRHPGCCCSWE